MLQVEITLWDGRQTTVLHRLGIVRDRGDKDPTIGNYRVDLDGREVCRLYGFARERGALALVKEAMAKDLRK